MSATIILVLGIALVFLYDFTNGFHDAADMVATAIASRAMSPTVAIGLVTVFTFLGPFLGGLAVANTIGEFVSIGDVDASIAQGVVLSAVLAAISYNLITWKLGLPTSSSNSLTSGLIGAALVTMGSSSVNWGLKAIESGHIEGFMKIITGMIFSPLAGFFVGFLVMKLFLLLFKRLSMHSTPVFIFTQYLSVSWLAFSHGTNDSQKGMGILGMLLLATGYYSTFTVPDWVILICASAITLGTMFGGWNIIRTVGFGIYRVRLIHSIADQVGAAAVILGSSMIGAPTSTTQVVTTTLVGAGAAERPKHVHWMVIKNIIAGWGFNIPICMALGAAFSFILMKLL